MQYGTRYDLLIAYRRLIRSAGSTLGIVMLMAIAIATAASVFTVAYSLLYKPLSYPAEQSLATLTAYSTKLGGDLDWSIPYLEAMRRARTLDAVAGYHVEDVALADHNGRYAGRAKAITLQPALFTLLGARPAFGRLLVADDAKTGAPPSVVIGGELWKSRYGNSRSVLGRSLRVGGRDHRVVGVLPEGFGFPQRDCQVWLPLVFSENERALSKAGQFGAFAELRAVGRLKPGQSMSDASAEMMQLARSEPILERVAERNGLELRAQPLRHVWVGERELYIKLMLLAVLMVLAGSTTALCYRYIVHVFGWIEGMAYLEPRRLMLFEVAMLCTAGGAIGAALAPLGLLLLRHFDILPTDTPQAIGGDWATTVFVVAIVAAMTAVMMVTGLGLRRRNIYVLFAMKGNYHIPAHRVWQVRETLILGQVMLPLILVFSTVLLGDRSHRLLNQDIGFERAELLVGRLQPLQSPQTDDLPRQRSMIAAWVAAVSSMPGVEAVGLATSAPFGETVNVQLFNPQGKGFLDPQSWPRAYTAYVNAQYFHALGLPILRGRPFVEEEMRVGAPVVIIDADFARTYFGDADPIGKRLSVKEYTAQPPVEVTVVGVAAVARHHTLENKDERSTLYRPETVPYRVHNIPVDAVEVLVRTRGAPTALIDALQYQVEQVAPELWFAQLIPMDERIAGTIKEQLRLNAILGILSGIATLFAFVGLHAIGVILQIREFGVRQVLGADGLRKDAKFPAAWLIGPPLVFLLGLMLAQWYAPSVFEPLSLLVALALSSLWSVIGLAANWWPVYPGSKPRRDVSPED